MTRFVCSNSSIFSVSEWKDNETNTYFWDIYVNGKFHSRHTSLNSVMSQVLKIIHDRKEKKC